MKMIIFFSHPCVKSLSILLTWATKLCTYLNDYTEIKNWIQTVDSCFIMLSKKARYNNYFKKKELIFSLLTIFFYMKTQNHWFFRFHFMLYMKLLSGPFRQYPIMHWSWIIGKKTSMFPILNVIFDGEISSCISYVGM